MLNIEKKLEDSLARYRGVPFELRDWEGTSHLAGTGTPRFLLHFRTRNALVRSFFETTLGFGESYAAGEIAVEGDLEEAVIALAQTYLHLDPIGWVPGWFQKLLGRTLTRQRADIEHHYGLGNEFYQFFLDKRLQYSCAYFRTPDDTLDLAQEQKVAYTTAKLDLRRGQRLLDIGCGWGHLMFHAAETYGVECLGLTLCENQANYIRERAQACKLSVEVRVMNYLELEIGKPWDRVVSVGMLEHAGREHADRYFDKFKAAIRPGGIGLLHSIATMREVRGTDPFLQKHIFPGYWFPPLDGMIRRAVERGLTIMDVEDLRRHYTLTVRRWRESFLRNWETIRKTTGFSDRFLRLWEFYFCCAIAGFQTGQLNLIQMVLANGPNEEYPRTRDFLFRQSIGSADSECLPADFRRMSDVRRR